MAIPFRYGWQSLWARRTTTAATALGIALVVFVLASSAMLVAGLKETLLRSGSAKRAIVLQQDGYSEGWSRIRQSAYTWVAAAPGVDKNENGEPRMTAEVVGHVYLPTARTATRSASLQVRGVMPNVFEFRPFAKIVEGRRATPGTDEAIVGRNIVGHFEGATLGGTIALQKKRKITIVGVFEAGGSSYDSEVWADIDTVRTSFNFQGYLSSVTAELESPRAFDAFKAALEGDKRQGLSVERERDYYLKVSENLSSVMATLGGLVTGIFALGALLGALITMHGAVSQRAREIGVLRALGFAPTQVLASFVVEAAALSLAGGALGCSLSLLTTLVDFKTINDATGQELSFRFLPSVPLLVTALGAGTLVGVLGGLYPAIQAARVNPVRAMRL
jgi:putative ABC transport system permease protein